jgi:probable rRNA maturation factor
MKLEIDVARLSPLWAGLPGVEALAGRAIRAAAAGVALREGAEVSARLVDDEAMRALNLRWRGLDEPTNVLAFPAAAPGKLAEAPLLGDILVAYETARREAAEQDLDFGDHVAHLIVHGFLHLVGFDHRDAEEARRMERREIRILAEIGVANPYVGTVPADEG